MENIKVGDKVTWSHAIFPLLAWLYAKQMGEGPFKVKHIYLDSVTNKPTDIEIEVDDQGKALFDPEMFRRVD